MKITAKAGSHVYEIVVNRSNGVYVVEVDGEERTVDAQALEGNFYTILSDGHSYEVSVERDGDGYLVRHGAAGQHVTFSDPGRQARESRAVADGPVSVVTQMPGRVVRVLVAKGDKVELGQGLAVVEAMKMENEIEAPKAGTVRSVDVEPGATIDGGGRLMVID